MTTATKTIPALSASLAKADAALAAERPPLRREAAENIRDALHHSGIFAGAPGNANLIDMLTQLQRMRAELLDNEATWLGLYRKDAHLLTCVKREFETAIGAVSELLRLSLRCA